MREGFWVLLETKNMLLSNLGASRPGILWNFDKDTREVGEWKTSFGKKIYASLSF